MTRKRHVVKNLVLDEVSGVTVPAQAHALVHMWKSEDMPLIDEITKRLNNGDAPTEEFAESLSKFEGGTREKVAQFVASCQHPNTRDTHIEVEVNKYFTTEENDNMSDELKKKAEGLEAQVAELTKSLEQAVTLSKMTDAEKEYLASLNDAAKADEFRAASSADRAKLMRKSAEADEVFKSAEGHEIRKSAVGDAVFALLKSQDENIRATREEMVKAADRALTVELTKRAEDELSNLPGDVSAKVAVLKGMHGLDEATRGHLDQMLKAGNEAIAKGFNSFGVGGAKSTDVTKATKLATVIAKLRETNPALTDAQAHAQALNAHPELYEG